MIRKLINLIILIFLPLVVFSQGRIAEIWTDPAIYAADEEVSWYFDVSGTALDGETQGVYLWSWFPSEPDEGNWASSSEFAALSHVEGNIWRMDLVPTEYYGVEANEIFAFYGLLKNKNGSKVTDAFAPDQEPPNHIQLYNLSLIEGDELMQHLPAEVFANRPLSIVVNANNTWSGCESSSVQGELAGAASVHIVAGLNDWEYSVNVTPETENKTQLISMGDGIYRIDMILEEYFSVPEDYDFDELEFVFVNNDSSIVGANSGCATFSISITDPPEIIPPELILFPQKISARDILTIIRKNNEETVSELTYSVYAEGTRVAQGSFTGNSDEMKTHINLVSALADYPDLTSIDITIWDNNSRTVVNTTLSLVNLNE